MNTQYLYYYTDDGTFKVTDIKPEPDDLESIEDGNLRVFTTVEGKFKEFNSDGELTDVLTP